MSQAWIYLVPGLIIPVLMFINIKSASTVKQKLWFAFGAGIMLANGLTLFFVSILDEVLK